VAQAQPGSAVGREAQRFLELLESPSGRWYSFSAALGLNYDSNVILAPAVGGGDAQTILGVSQKSDGEGVIRAGALLVPWQRGATVSLAYDFFQSYHFELVEFDLQAHTVSTQVSSEAGAFRFGLLGRYDYSLLDTQSFVQAATGSPWLTVRTGDIGRFALFYRVLWSDVIVGILVQVVAGLTLDRAVANAEAIYIYSIIYSIHVAIIAGRSRRIGVVLVVIVAVDIGANAVAVSIADPGTGRSRACAIAVRVVNVIDGRVITVVASCSGRANGRADAIAVRIEYIVHGLRVSVITRCADRTVRFDGVVAAACQE
jgi:hypothetical protein